MLPLSKLSLLLYRLLENGLCQRKDDVSSWATCAQQNEMILAPSSGQILHKQAIYWLLVFFLNILYEDNLLCYVDDLKKIVYIY